MRRLLPFLALALAACSSAESGAAAGRSSGDSAAAPAAAPPATAAAPAPAPAAAADPWAVRFDGAGPVRVGMTADEARAALGGDFQLRGETSGVNSAPDACLMALAGGAPPRLSFMLVGQRVVRVDARDSSTVATAEGIRVGDSEARVQEVYAGRVQVQPHKYDEKGRYLVVRPASPADTTHLLVFETDGQRVVRYRAGVRPQVEWVEGCS